MTLDLLPTRDAGAAPNMATDFLLLQHYPRAAHARLRCYGWHRPAVTFGFGQRLAWVRGNLPAGFEGELCRRPTGGGIVDHRADWTYALVIPRGATLADARAIETYRVVHEALAAALRDLGVAVALQASCPPPCGEDGCAPGPGLCFTHAEIHDLIAPADGRKLAGAAQKRSRHGLLCQGSVDRDGVERNGPVDWEIVRDRFAHHLSVALAWPAVETSWPEWDGTVDALADDFAAPGWNERR
jgi:lipoyl(octanoyl) transferase